VLLLSTSRFLKGIQKLLMSSSSCSYPFHLLCNTMF
jgi:hypothetical protein